MDKLICHVLENFNGYHVLLFLTNFGTRKKNSDSAGIIPSNSGISARNKTLVITNFACLKVVGFKLKILLDICDWYTNIPVPGVLSGLVKKRVSTEENTTLVVIVLFCS